MIIKIITIFLLLLSVCSDLCSAESAEYGCTNCNAWNLTYYCVECDEDNGYTLYLQSCRNDNEEIGVFIALAIVLLIVYFFMLVMGIGVYHSYF